MNDCAFVQYKLSVARYLSQDSLVGCIRSPSLLAVTSFSLQAWPSTEASLASGKDTVGHCRHCHLPGGCVGFCSAKGL